MTYTAEDRACMKITESRNRLRSAVEALKKDVRYDLTCSREQIARFGAEIGQTGQAKIAEQPFVAVAAGLAAGFLVGKWARSHLTCRQFEKNMQTRWCSGI
jgi:ElaB/YqjD/DUF883 family membrane-anchored ribosome-binding protein